MYHSLFSHRVIMGDLILVNFFVYSHIDFLLCLYRGLLYIYNHYVNVRDLHFELPRLVLVNNIKCRWVLNPHSPLVKMTKRVSYLYIFMCDEQNKF